MLSIHTSKGGLRTNYRPLGLRDKLSQPSLSLKRSDMSLRERIVEVISKENATVGTPSYTMTPGEISYKILAAVIQEIDKVENPYKPNPLREFDHEITMQLRDGFESVREVIKEALKQGRRPTKTV